MHWRSRRGDVTLVEQDKVRETVELLQVTEPLQGREAQAPETPKPQARCHAELMLGTSPALGCSVDAVS